MMDLGFAVNEKYFTGAGNGLIWEIMLDNNNCIPKNILENISADEIRLHLQPGTYHPQDIGCIAENIRRYSLEMSLNTVVVHPFPLGGGKENFIYFINRLSEAISDYGVNVEIENGAPAPRERKKEQLSNPDEIGDLITAEFYDSSMSRLVLDIGKAAEYYSSLMPYDEVPDRIRKFIKDYDDIIASVHFCDKARHDDRLITVPPGSREGILDSLAMLNLLINKRIILESNQDTQAAYNTAEEIHEAVR